MLYYTLCHKTKQFSRGKHGFLRALGLLCKLHKKRLLNFLPISMENGRIICYNIIMVVQKCNAKNWYKQYVRTPVMLLAALHE